MKWNRTSGDAQGTGRRQKLLMRLKEAWELNRGEPLWWVQCSREDALVLDPTADFSDYYRDEFPTLEGSEVERLLKLEGMI